MTDQEKIADLERQLAEQTRRAEIAEAWQKRLTALLAQNSAVPDSRAQPASPSQEADRG